MKKPFAGVASFSTQGKRETQEDAFLQNPDKGVFVVADGFGGPVAGVEASRAACDAIRAFLEKGVRDADATLPFVMRKYYSLAANVLFNSILHANRKVMHRNRDKNVNEKGGSCVVAAYFDGSHLAVANVGSCGAFLVRDGVHTPLVLPRTYARLLDSRPGAFPRSAENRLDLPLMALGMTDDLEPEIVEAQVRPGDIVILTSKPLHVMRGDQDVSELTRSLSRSPRLIEDVNATYSIIYV